MTQSNKTRVAWIPLGRSFRLLFTRKRLFGTSIILFLATALLTWLGYQLSVNFIDNFTSQFFNNVSESTSVLGWLKTQLVLGLEWLYLVISRVIAFYLAFLIAFTLTSPGYVLLSTSAEKLHAEDKFSDQEDGLSLRNISLDLLEGVKIGMIGLIITPIVLLVNFIPIIGQVVGFVLYTYYSALMFVDYPSSRRRWSLGKKIRWIVKRKWISFRIGLLPAMISLVPIVNIFFMALLFPLLTIHTTLNFTAIEDNVEAKRR